MRILRHFVLICTILVVPGYPVGQASSDNTKNDDRVKLTIDWHTSSPDLIEARAREFIWAHFTGRREGDLTLKLFSTEGEPSISHYHITSESGTWKVDVVIERHLKDRRSHKPIDTTDRFTAYDLQLVISKSGTQVTEIPAGSGLEFFKRCTLRMMDKNGKQITEF